MEEEATESKGIGKGVTSFRLYEENKEGMTVDLERWTNGWESVLNSPTKKVTVFCGSESN